MILSINNRNYLLIGKNTKYVKPYTETDSNKIKIYKQVINYNAEENQRLKRNYVQENQKLFH